MKRLLILSGMLFILLMGGVVASAQSGSGISSACRNVDGRTNSVVRIGVPDDAVDGGAGIAGCRVVHDGSRFILSPAVIGNLGVIRQGVLAAVDVFGFSGSGAVNNFGAEVQICLRGTGSFIFLNANTTPRIPSQMPAVTRELEDGAYTCTFISGGGVAVLVNGPAAPSEAVAGLTAAASDTTSAEADPAAITPDDSPAVPTTGSVVGAQSLSGCRVTTTAMVRLREEPNTTSGIITRLPFEFSLQATSRTDDWAQVIWRDRQGWVSTNYLNFSAGCETP